MRNAGRALWLTFSRAIAAAWPDLPEAILEQDGHTWSRMTPLALNTQTEPRFAIQGLARSRWSRTRDQDGSLAEPNAAHPSLARYGRKRWQYLAGPSTVRSSVRHISRSIGPLRRRPSQLGNG